VEELEKLCGQSVKDLHRPYIDNVLIKKDGKVFKRRSEVLDSWMDAGSMPYAQVHYPFENKEKFTKNFPGDYIVEYTGQVRAWFYVMHVLSNALFGTYSFKNVVVTGVIAGSDGRKMSKTYNNYADPKEVLKNYGGDALRLYLMGSVLMVGENANFDETELKIKLRNVLNPLWNSLKFFDLYAKSHKWNTEKYEESDDVLDSWISARLNEVIRDLSTTIEQYNLPPAVKIIEEFVDDLSRWYVRRSRDRISSGDAKAISTLYKVLLTFSKVSAPLIPFISEEIFQVLKKYTEEQSEESIHLTEFPVFNEVIMRTKSDTVSDMIKVRNIVSLGHMARIDSGISVRQPLKQMNVSGIETVKDSYIEIIKDELNIKNIAFSSKMPKAGKLFEVGGISVKIDTNITEDLKIEGMAREMVRQIQDLRKEKHLYVSDRINVIYPNNPENERVVEMYGKEIAKKVMADKLTPGQKYAINKEI
jgi:isoleucyl-tRNA synthetase